MKVLVTGGSGFICGYLCQYMLEQGISVVNVDNWSKYGEVKKSYDKHLNYTFHYGDAGDTNLLIKLLADCDYFIPAASMVGGIAYFHEKAYDLIEENNRLIGAAFRAAIRVRMGNGSILKKIIVVSSSMVYENATTFPTSEACLVTSPIPSSTYGAQKLICEHYAKGAFEQYKLPYTIVRPFNAIGIGELKTLYGKEITSGNIKLSMSHVVPDLVTKALKAQNPMHLLGDGTQVRHYTYAGDLARGIYLAMLHPAALNEDFNISTRVQHTVKQVAEIIWKKVHGENAKPLEFAYDKSYKYDVQLRSPDCNKAEKYLGFKAETSLEEALDEIIPWVRQQIEQGKI